MLQQIITLLTPAVQFFKGTTAKLGTSSNLLREVSVSILTAMVVALVVNLLTPAPPSPAQELQALLRPILYAQHEADSLRGIIATYPLQQRIDFLEDELHDRDLADSLRATAGLGPLDAMHRINGAIGGATAPARHSRRGAE